VKIITDAFVRGGGLGILGDVLFNDYTKDHGGVANLFGPTVGSLGDFASMFQTGLSDVTGVQHSNIANNAITFVSNHLPIVNLWFAKAAWQYFVLQGLQEAVNPGYLGRMQRRLERQDHQHLLVSPLY
jgi:hypothetical protein